MLGLRAWRIGRIGGIDVKIDPSWSIIALLIGTTFYAILSGEYPNDPTGGLVAAAIVMTIVLFASVLLHELAHSWMARSKGIEVRGITLFLFGGVTQADLDTEDASDELVIAAVGPLTSLAIAAVLWGVAVATSGFTAYAAGQLGWINLTLAVFNLVPGFPLDGGRILRASIWRARGDIVAATRIAARSGQIVGYLLIGSGLFELFAYGALIGGLWLAAIGWFLAQSAQASFLHLRVRRMLEHVPAWRFLGAQDVVEVPADLTLQDAVDHYFLHHDHGAFPVRDGTTIVGVLPIATVRRIPRAEWPVRQVRDAAIPLSEAVTVSRSTPMSEVLEKMGLDEDGGNGTHRVVVMDGAEVAGVITSRDLVRWLQRSQELGLTEPLESVRR